jgi:hypothetical protein
MEKQIFSALIAILFALSGWALTSINKLQVEMGQVMVGHVSSQDVYELRRQVDRLEILLESQAAEK